MTKSKLLLNIILVGLIFGCSGNSKKHKYINNKKYIFYTTPKTYLNAMKTCLHQKMILVQAKHYSKHVLRTFEKNIRYPYWIDLTDIMYEGKFVNLDGVLVKNIKWSYKQPDNWSNTGGKEHCTHYAYANLAVDNLCNIKLRFICEGHVETAKKSNWKEILKRRKEKLIKQEKILTSQATRRLYLRLWINKKMIVLNYSSLTFLNAAKKCIQQGMILYSPINSQEFTYIAKRTLTYEQFWIGLTDLVRENSFSDFYGRKMKHSKWLKNQSDNSGNQDCVQKNKATMIDVTCKKKLFYLCESITENKHKVLRTAKAILKKLENLNFDKKRQTQSNNEKTEIKQKIRIRMTQKAKRIYNRFY